MNFFLSQKVAEATRMPERDTKRKQTGSGVASSLTVAALVASFLLIALVADGHWRVGVSPRVFCRFMHAASSVFP